MMNKRIWSDEEIQYLVDHFSDCYTVDICNHLQRSYSSVSQKAALLDLKKSAAFKNMELQRQGTRLKESGKHSRFVKGQIPHNKGAKLPEHIKQKIEHTQFKKGNAPHNTKFDGAISIRVDKTGKPYQYIRVSKAKWVLLHRHLWESVKGPLTKGAVLRFKDGNSMNCSIENLELIDLKTNMLLNSIHRYPEEFKPVIKSLNKLKQKIVAHEKQNHRPE